jgi:very-short-patch-repair endonuclease
MDAVEREFRKKRPNKRTKQDGPSPLEERFDRLWKEAGGPELVREHKFHPTRKWSADFAHIPTRVIIEIEGGVYMRRGRHTTATGFIKDCEKYGTATLMGWTVFRLPTPHVEMEWVEKIVRFVVDRNTPKSA